MKHFTNNSGMHIPFKCPQNIYQDSPYPGPENKKQTSKKLKELKTYRIYSLTAMG